MTDTMTDKPIRERCADCDDCARHAYSDATTPGFFYSRCERHRLLDRAVNAEAERDTLRTALTRLTTKLKAIDASESFFTVFAVAQLHGYPYDGPNWNEDLAAACAVLGASR